LNKNGGRIMGDITATLQQASGFRCGFFRPGTSRPPLSRQQALSVRFGDDTIIPEMKLIFH